MAGERESGTLRRLLAQGVTPGQVVLGKLLGVGGVAAVLLLPALAGLSIVAVAGSVPAALIGMLAAGYAACSAISARERTRPSTTTAPSANPSSAPSGRRRRR